MMKATLTSEGADNALLYSSWMPTLGVNLDHVATLRQLRGTPYPDLLLAARLVQAAGAGQITVHLREDRRHIQEADVLALRKSIQVPLNLEMAATEPMVKFAIKNRPDWVCLVPEKRQEVTTEGGLDLKKNKKKLTTVVSKLKKAGIQVSLFIEPSIASVELSRAIGADAVELHTGRYCIAAQSSSKAVAKNLIPELERIHTAGELAENIGLRVHAGHGLDVDNVRAVAVLMSQQNPQRPLITEYNIGHSLVCRAVLVGLERAVREIISAIVAL